MHMLESMSVFYRRAAGTRPAEQVAVFEGRAAVPLAGLAAPLRADRFRKLFFLHPDSEELLGRVDVGYGAAGAAVHPLYFRASVGPSVVPGASLTLSSGLCHCSRQLPLEA